MTSSFSFLIFSLYDSSHSVNWRTILRKLTSNSSIVLLNCSCSRLESASNVSSVCISSPFRATN
ncbi:Uncharacterised protein [Vibrio cholerae]|nr:Uncharacterised protein [Vibrio cholerae]